MDRTLYLSESKGMEVLRDGPSLWIRQEQRAGRRIPVRLIGRVVIIGNVRMDAGAITLFTENGIPVTFMNRRGEEVAVTMPYNDRFARHYEEQKILLTPERHRERALRWIAAKRHWVQFRCLKRLARLGRQRLDTDNFRERDYQDFVRGLAPVKEDKWQVVQAVLATLFRETAIAAVLKADLDPHMGVLHRRHNFGLALDLVHMIEAEADMQAVQFFLTARAAERLVKNAEGWAVTREGIHDIVQRMENRRKALDELIGLILDDLFRLMRELRV